MSEYASLIERHLDLNGWLAGSSLTLATVLGSWVCLGPWCGLKVGLRSMENKFWFCQHVHVQIRFSLQQGLCGSVAGSGTKLL